MRRSFVVVACALVGSACAAIAGLEEPTELEPTAPDGGDDASFDAPATPDASDGGAGLDADAGRICTGSTTKLDAFDNRPDADTGWTRSYLGDGGVIEIADGGLHIVIPPATSGVNIHRQLGFTKNGARRLCASFTVKVAKPVDTTAYFGSGDTVFGFIASEGGDAGSFFHGIRVSAQGVGLYTTRAGNVVDSQPTGVPLGAKWSVFFEANYEEDMLTLVVNGVEKTFPGFRPVVSPNATFFVGVRNVGPAPEADAVIDDVVVGAD